MKLKCPECGHDDQLVELVEVPGWRNIDSDGEVLKGSLNREIEWDDAAPTGELQCDWCNKQAFKRIFEV